MELEYRLYYDSVGRPVSYALATESAELSGEFIVITREQFARAAMNVVVRNGKVYDARALRTLAKFVPSDRGTRTSSYDISIIADDSTDDVVYWALSTQHTDRGPTK